MVNFAISQPTAHKNRHGTDRCWPRRSEKVLLRRCRSVPITDATDRVLGNNVTLLQFGVL